KPSVSTGITGQTGPVVEFPIYTEPHKFPNGFNPSDHVETRVARLYYFRDAHRVTQIIARDKAKSYNRQAVEVRRRMADKARDVANQRTDERRALERAAVRAAQEARAAERELQQAQAQLNQAQQQLNETQPRIDQLKAELNTAGTSDAR